jgi:hypothetical protein
LLAPNSAIGNNRRAAQNYGQENVEEENIRFDRS